MRPFPSEASAALLPPPLLRLLPGGAIQFPGGPFIPLWTNAFHGALKWPDCYSYQLGRALLGCYFKNLKESSAVLSVRCAFSKSKGFKGTSEYPSLVDAILMSSS